MGRILIADDHDALRRGLARALTEAGHEVDEAPNGNIAIERLHDNQPIIVNLRELAPSCPTSHCRRTERDRPEQVHAPHRRPVRRRMPGLRRRQR